MSENKRFYLDENGINDREYEFSLLGEDELVDIINALNDENEQLKQNNDKLIHLLENQSIIIHELHSKLMHYQLEEPIVLTKEDLEIMGKAISYYTHEVKE